MQKADIIGDGITWLFRRVMMMIGLLGASSGMAQSEPDHVTLDAGTFKWGGDVRARSHMFMQMPFTLTNRLSSDFRGKLTLVPASSQTRQTIISQKELSLGAEAVVEDVAHYPASRVDSVDVRLEDRAGNLLGTTEIPTIFESSYYRRFVYVVNDDETLTGVSDLGKFDNLLDRLVLTRSRASQMPVRWNQYNPTSIIVFHQPRLETATASQLQAVRDFVASGGSLLITSPAGLNSVAESALFDMLPADLLDIRPISSIPELSDWAVAYRAADDGQPFQPPVWPEGTSLAELAPRDNAFVPLQQNDLPLICWRRYGCGWVGVTAFDAWSEPLRKTGLNTLIWNHFLSWSGDHPLTTGTIFSPALDTTVERLSGFQAADTATVHRILLLNGLVVVLILTTGILLRKQAWAWAVLVGYGIVAAAFVFHAAQRRATTQSPRSVVAMDFHGLGRNGAARALHVSFFSRSGDSPTVVGRSHDVFFQPPTAPLSRSILSIFQQRNDTSSFQFVETADGIQQCHNFRIRALQNRALGSFAPGDSQGTNLPNTTLNLGSNTPNLQSDATVGPEEFWYLALGNGVVHCTPNSADDTTTLTANFNADQAIKLDPVMHEIEKFLNQATLSRSTLIQVQRVKRSDDTTALPFGLSQPFQAIHYRFSMTPVHQTTTNTEIHITPAQIPLRPASRSTQSALALDEMIMIRSSSESYLFAAALPPELAGITPKTVEIDLSIINPSGMLEAYPRLCMNPVFDADRTLIHSAKDELKPSERKGKRFTFTLPEDARLQDPITGQFFVQIIVERRATSDDTTDISGRANAMSAGDMWQFQTLAVAVTGDVPAAEEPSATP